MTADATTDPTALQEVRSRGRVRGRLPRLGPAGVAAIAYVDPGNFATNFSAGAEFGYRLAWVIVAANLMAMLIQSLSGKVGLATGRNLPELCREHFPRPATRALWVPIGLHIGWNFAAAGIFGTVVSGSDMPQGLLHGVTSGTDLLTGGDFGPEGSIYAVLACSLVTIGFLVLAHRRGTIIAGPRRAARVASTVSV